MAQAALWEAARAGDVESIFFMVSIRKAAVNKPNAHDNKKTAAHYAAENGREAALKVLVELGADLTLIDATGRTVLLSALSSPTLSSPVVRFICARVPPDTLEERDPHGFTPLMLACKSGNMQVVDWLLRAGCDMSAVDRCGCSALHLTSQLGNIKIAQVLLKSGCSVDMKDAKGYTAYEYAVLYGHEALARLLLSLTPPPPDIMALTRQATDIIDSKEEKVEKEVKLTHKSAEVKLAIVPKSSELLVNVRAAEADGSRHITTVRNTSKYIACDTFPDGELSITIFSVLNGEVDDSALSSGSFADEHFSAGASDTRLILSRFTARKTTETAADGTLRGSITPDFIDTAAHVVQLESKYKDEVMVGGVTTGDFFPAAAKTVFSVRKTTKSDGKSEIVVCDGKLSVCVKKGAIKLPLPDLLLKPRQAAPSADAGPAPLRRKLLKSCSVIMEADAAAHTPLVMLADHSGSMGEHVDRLRATLARAVEEAVERGVQIAIAVWNHVTEFHTTGLQTSQYITKDHVADVEAWIAGIVADGGTEITQALQRATAKFPDARSFLVMTDGQFGDVRNWFATFRAAHPHATFSFVAFSKAADAAQLQELADTGNGSMTLSDTF